MARILNVQDIIIERTKETSISYAYSCKSVYASIRVPGTHNEGLPTQYRINVGPASQPIAGSMLVNCIRRWPNIKTELGDCPVFALTAFPVNTKHLYNIYTMSALTGALTLYLSKGYYPLTPYIGQIVKTCWATVCDVGQHYSNQNPLSS